jgi:hypothetical protein
MPPRCSTGSAAAADGHATSALAPLPLPVVLYIFSLLPVDCRLRCVEVCRGWRAVLLERSLWTRLDLSAASGVRMREGNALDALLRCAAARAGGGLQSLRIVKSIVTHATLLEVAAANAGALRELHAKTLITTSGLLISQRSCLAPRRCWTCSTPTCVATPRRCRLRAARCATRRPSGRCACGAYAH